MRNSGWKFLAKMQTLSFSKAAIVEMNLFQENGVEQIQGDVSPEAQGALRQDR
jgi:hypothetical protein